MDISIIVPVFNSEEYLADCIESLLRQDVENYEIILVNDGSTDKSGEICNYYAKEYSNVILMEKENGGQSSARNLGLSIARGEYVMFVDSDDLLEPNVLQCFLSKAKEFNVDIVHAKCTVYNETAQIPSIGRVSRYVCLEESVSGMEYIRRCLNFGCYDIVPVDNFIRKSFIETIGLVFPEGVFMEDHLFTAQLFMNASSIIEIDVPFYRYRKHGGSTTTVIDDTKIHDTIHVIEMMYYYILGFFCSEYEKKDLYPLITHSMGVLIGFLEKCSLSKMRKARRQIKPEIVAIAKKYPIGIKSVNMQCRLFAISPMFERIFMKLFGFFVMLRNRVQRLDK